MTLDIPVLETIPPFIAFMAKWPQVYYRDLLMEMEECDRKLDCFKCVSIQLCKTMYGKRIDSLIDKQAFRSHKWEA